MQTVIQVISERTTSLRDAIAKDQKKLKRFGLVVSEQKRATRAPGWTKIHMPGEIGAINVEWHGASRTLICRIVTKHDPPDRIAGAFVNYLLARRGFKIQSIQIIPG